MVAMICLALNWQVFLEHPGNRQRGGERTWDGRNSRAMLITKGLSEIIHLAKAMGADVRSFLGLQE